MASTKKTAQSTLILNNNVDGGDQEIEGSIGGFGPEDIAVLYSARHGRNHSLTWGQSSPPPNEEERNPQRSSVVAAKYCKSPLHERAHVEPHSD